MVKLYLGLLKICSSKRGFSLIEIVIVISIIAVLASLVMPNFFGARIKAKDARRKNDIAQIQKSLELYKSDQSPPAYPASNFMTGLCNSIWQSGTNIYIKSLPCDPATSAIYTYTLNATDSLKYTLTACLENTRDPNRDATNLAICSATGKVSYTVSEP